MVESLVVCYDSAKSICSGPIQGAVGSDLQGIDRSISGNKIPAPAIEFQDTVSCCEIHDAILILYHIKTDIVEAFLRRRKMGEKVIARLGKRVQKNEQKKS